ncbi:SDR family oxidoreductase [Flavobacterium sp. SUN052]|uniref:SDR family oxidoreductase n=1 Tax=Flavobacterium sp. SUN052 TaxID=3002441 RepID=UPI00237DDD4C|nr:SDR family oxidoreductase [Flavobacterium sp. SUN052]MEC4003723.1 SDR family oxidoreductase [Flavobacterium sp. SUN052]
MDTKKVWFVTGASKGLGLNLVKKLLLEGYKVAATSRKLNDLILAIGEKSNCFFPLEMNIVDDKNVALAISKTVQYFQKIDVVVNNAGYTQVGTIEELSDDEVRKNFDVNVFGVFNVIRNTIPYFRNQKSGHFFTISSMAGFSGGFAGWSSYCATKFAVAGMTESLAVEAREFGIKTTLVYPGHLRTNFLEKGSIMSAKNPIDAYVSVRQSELLVANKMNGNQEGDPEKAATAIIKMSNEENPALHFFMGEDAYKTAIAKMKIVNNELENWKKQSLSTGFSE